MISFDLDQESNSPFVPSPLTFNKARRFQVVNNLSNAANRISARVGKFLIVRYASVLQF